MIESGELYRSRRTRRSALKGAALASGAGALLAACGGRKTGLAKSSPGTPAGGKPRLGGQLNAPQTNDPYNYDPTIEPQSNSFTFALACDGLLDAKTGSDVKFTDVIVQPGLADRWETPDAQTYTFHLHPGVRFANQQPTNGRALSSADVKFSYEYLSRSGQFKGSKLPPSIEATYFTGMDRVDTPDPLTVVVHFQTPFSPFLNYMAMRNWNPILAHEIYDQDGDFSKRTVGTGPWQEDLAASQQGQRWTMRRNPTYFKTGQPYIDTIQYLIFTDTASQLAAFQAKQIDVLLHTAIPSNGAAQVQKANPQAVDIPFLSNAGGHLFENTRKPPLDDVRVRRAIAFAIDRDAFIKAFSDGQGEWAAAGGVQGLFTQDELRKLEPHDPTQARQLLSAAGYGNGLDLELIYTAGAGNEQMLNIDQLIQAQLKGVGINVTLKGLDRPTYNAVTRAGNYQINWETKGVMGDPDMYIYFTFYSKALGNYGGFADPVLDKLLESQRQEVDASKRKDILRQAVQRIVDQAWSVGFFYGQAHTFVQPYVKNLAENALSGYPQAFQAWLTK